MKRLAFAISALFALSGCSSDSESFTGRWDGRFASVDNLCPFSLSEDINPLFPLSISVDDANQFTVVAVDGSTAVGGQGEGEFISFTALARQFGDFGPTGTYTCTQTASQVKFVSLGGDQAGITIVYTFKGCRTPGNNTPVECAASYAADAQKVG